MTPLVPLIIGVGSVISIYAFPSRVTKPSRASIHNLCLTGKEFVQWYLCNPGVFIGLSEEGRRLLSKFINAIETVSEETGQPKNRYAKLIKQLEELYNRLPPKSPDTMPVKRAKAQARPAFVSLQLDDIIYIKERHCCRSFEGCFGHR